MHGLWAAVGPTANQRVPHWEVPGEIQEARFDGARIQRHSPVGQPLPAWQGQSRSGRVRVFLDGEITVRGLSGARGLATHIAAFAEAVEAHGVNRALEGLGAGTFNALVLEGDGRALLLRDPLGTIPVYEAEAGPDWLVSTNPVSLARAEGVNSTPDRVGLASLALVGYTLGTRHLTRGVRMVRTGVQRVRDAHGRLSAKPLPLNVFAHLAESRGGPSVDAIAEAFIKGCAQLASSNVPTAHLQSGGMDSRLILAAWPKDQPITCYGYGDPDSGEVAIARDVAKLRGAPYHHIQPDGDQVSQLVDPVFEANGFMAYPSRWFLSEQIAADGHTRVLDGFAGDILLGHHFYPHRRTALGLVSKMMARYKDAQIDSIGMEPLAKEVYSRICELAEPRKLSGLLHTDFISDLESAREDIVADIHDELSRLRPANGSLITLVHNFTVANRSAHSTLQQGVMSRHNLDVGYPFAADYDFLKLALSIPPSRSAYRRIQIAIFRKYFPDYAKLPYSGTMLPLGRSPRSHQTAEVLMKLGLRIPGLTGRQTRSPNNWKRWLRESDALRQRLATALRSGGIAGDRLDERMNELADGRLAGNGKLLHIASVGRWLAMLPRTRRTVRQQRPGWQASVLGVPETALAATSGTYKIPMERRTRNK